MDKEFETFRKLFATLSDRELESLGLVLTERQLEQFYTFYKILIEWNQVMNLTAITEPEEVIVKHFVDSLSLARAVDGLGDLAESGCSLIDVGTGAGFPGIPLKIAYPGLRLKMCIRDRKRVESGDRHCAESSDRSGGLLCICSDDEIFQR